MLKLIHSIANKQLIATEIMQMLDLSGRDNFRKGYLLPALQAGYLVMKFPDNPKHRNQKYLLTSKGLDKLKEKNK